METPKTLEEILAEAKKNNKSSFNLAPPRASNWPELRLDGHVRRLQISFVLYFIMFAMFWCHVLGVVVFPLGVVLAFVVVAPANYLFLVWTAYTIQRVLRDAGQQKHGGWQVVVGALVLNPVVVGWYIPLSVLISAVRVRRKLGPS